MTSSLIFCGCKENIQEKYIIKTYVDFVMLEIFSIKFIKFK